LGCVKIAFFIDGQGRGIGAGIEGFQQGRSRFGQFVLLNRAAGADADDVEVTVGIDDRVSEYP
jgi:hypothetical protein